MTDRVSVLTVALEIDWRDDDVKGIVDTILHVKGVLAVTTNVVTSDQWLAEQRAYDRLRGKIAEILWPMPSKNEAQR